MTNTAPLNPLQNRESTDGTIVLRRTQRIVLRRAHTNASELFASQYEIFDDQVSDRDVIALRKVSHCESFVYHSILLIYNF